MLPLILPHISPHQFDVYCELEAKTAKPTPIRTIKEANETIRRTEKTLTFRIYIYKRLIFLRFKPIAAETALTPQV
jgi:hypothetical protein